MTAFTSTLPRAVDSIRIARTLVEIHASRLTRARREDAALMVSELVSNALHHGRGQITLRITPAADHLTVDVADEGDGEVAIAAARRTRDGWGLRIVDELADTWGADTGRTRVWFRLARAKILRAVESPPRA